MDLIRNGGGIFREQTVIKNLSGELRHVWVSLKYPSAPPYSSIPITLHDVTDQVNAANTVRESEGRLRNIIDQSPDPILILKGEDLVLDVANEPLFKLWQVGHEAIGKPFLEILPEMKNQGFHDLLLKVYREGYTHYGYETPAHFERRVGILETVYFDFIYQPFRENDGEISGVLVTAKDVTKEVMDRRALQESESRFRTLAETLPQMIWVTDEKGNIEYTSQQWREYSGIENPFEAWDAMVHPEDKSRMSLLYKKAFEEGVPFKAEGRLKSKTGEYRWHTSIAEPLRNEEGKVVKWIGALTDIHEQKMVAERLEQLVNERTKELKRSNEDLQQFAHVASHDLKEPLRKVIMFSSRLKDELGTSVTEKSISFLDKIANSALRMYSMIDGVLLYSSADVLEQASEPIDLGKLLQSIETDLEVVISEKHAVITYEHLPIIEGSAVLIYQLFYNLLSNSLKFSRDGVPPKILIESTDLNGEQVAGIGLSPTGKYWKITIRDNGIGFDLEQAEKIFGTFTRLHSKDKYEGTGLGLSLCRKIAERHGGAIYAEGIPDQGSVFTLLLPK
jgi:PAS domain S-box-containing protein